MHMSILDKMRIMNKKILSLARNSHLVWAAIFLLTSIEQVGKGSVRCLQNYVTSKINTRCEEVEKKRKIIIRHRRLLIYIYMYPSITTCSLIILGNAMRHSYLDVSFEDDIFM